MSGSHHHDYASELPTANVISADRLGETADGRSGISYEYLATIVKEQAALVEHQWSQGLTHGLVRGYLLSGPPGVGKTTLARRLIHELGQRFLAPSGRTAVVAVFVDGGTIARAKYGESEQRIRGLFEAARHGLGNPTQRVVLVFDDVESILMSRGATYAREWHFSQDSAFFHAIDEMDTSRTTVVLTTNRADLVDDAIRDRFLEYRIDYPPGEVLLDAARQRCISQGLDEAAIASLDQSLDVAIASGAVRSLRDAEHFAARHWIATVLAGARPATASRVS